MNFWETRDWMELKTIVLRTDKLLTKSEYLKQVGYKNFSEEKYKKYLDVMRNNDPKLQETNN